MKTVEEKLNLAQLKIIKKLREMGIPNSVEIWTEDGSVMLGFGEFVAQINEYEVRYVAGLEL